MKNYIKKSPFYSARKIAWNHEITCQFWWYRWSENFYLWCDGVRELYGFSSIIIASRGSVVIWCQAKLVSVAPLQSSAADMILIFWREPPPPVGCRSHQQLSHLPVSVLAWDHQHLPPLPRPPFKCQVRSERAEKAISTYQVTPNTTHNSRPNEQQFSPHNCCRCISGPSR